MLRRDYMAENINDELKKLLFNFTPINEHTKDVSEENKSVVDSNMNPLNPNLIEYCFDKVLGFKVQYRIYEKVNYIIEFDYKGTYGYIAHRKLSFKMTINKKYLEEIIELFQSARNLLEESFLNYGKLALENNQFTMENEHYQYMSKLEFYCELITELEEDLVLLETSITETLKDVSSITEHCNVYNDYSKKRSKNRQEQKYAIESYIDSFFAYLEHLLTLLFPFTPNFDLKKSYSKNYIHNIKWSWDRKLEDVSCGEKKLLDYIEKLREIKEIYRNRNAHGMFSREMKVYAEIDGFGRYPMYIGKNYLKGFIDDYHISLTYSKFEEIKQIFDSLINDLRIAHRIPMAFIEGETHIPVETVLLTENVSSIEEAERLIEYYHFEMDNQFNMDW